MSTDKTVKKEPKNESSSSNANKQLEEEAEGTKSAEGEGDKRKATKSSSYKHTSRGRAKENSNEDSIDERKIKSKRSKSPRKDKKKETKDAGKENKEKKSTQRNPNKIYRCPPTPTPQELSMLERQFTLDCIAVNTTSQDYSRTRPKLGQIIPPYNAQKDKAAIPYFEFTGIKKTLRKTGQQYPGEPMEGETMLRFHESGAGYNYLSRRNLCGAGHSRETIDGHAQFMNDIKPIDGYNGRFGYRRTNPALRKCPSTFGVVSDLPIH